VHCHDGIGRTGAFVALYRMEYQGWPNERARREAVVWPGYSSFDKDQRKGKFVLGYTPRSRRGRDAPPRPPARKSGQTSNAE